MLDDLARNPSNDPTASLSFRIQNEIVEFSSTCWGFPTPARRGSADARSAGAA
jgi:hypothetical protein